MTMMCDVVMSFMVGFGAAKHLASQGLDVTLLDASPNPGGLSAGWRTKQGRAVEAGVKGFWYQYANIFSLVAELGIEWCAPLLLLAAPCLLHEQALARAQTACSSLAQAFHGLDAIRLLGPGRRAAHRGTRLLEAAAAAHHAGPIRSYIPAIQARS